MNSELILKINNDPYGFSENITVLKLEQILRKLSHHYYNTKKPLIADNVFDILKDVLEKKDANNPFLREIGAPISKDKVKLPFPLGSLDKIKPSTKELDKWVIKFPGKKVLSDKLDGNSALFVKDKNGLKLYSRGDGFNGQDISHLISYVIPHNTIKNLPNKIAIRGELIISKANFNKVKTTIKRKGGTQYANARNTVAGLVNSKTYSIELAKLVDFVAYSIIYPGYKWHEQMKLIKKLGLKTVYNKTVEEINNVMLSKLLLKRRSSGDYEIDGIVVYDSEKVHKHQSGNPIYGFAFKQVLTDQVAEAKVKKVEWNVSKDGYLKPRVFIESVNLMGVDIDKATGHNAAFICDNNIGPGAVIKIVRSGDVIPYISKVLKPSITGKPQMPEGKYEWNKSKVDIVSIDDNDMDEIKVKRLTYFFTTLNVKFISIGIVRKLVKNGYDTIKKWLTVDKKKLAEIDGIGEKLIKKIDKSFSDTIKKTSLYTLMSASNIFGRNLGSKKLKLIVQEYPNILIMNENKKNLMIKIKSIIGFDDILVKQFVDNLDTYKKFHNNLEKIINLKHLSNIQLNKNGKFKGMTFVFTGYRNKEWEEIIEKEGGKVTGSVSKNTDVVVYTDQSSSKYKKALELKNNGHSIKLMTPEKIEKLIL